MQELFSLSYHLHQGLALDGQVLGKQYVARLWNGSEEKLLCFSSFGAMRNLVNINTVLAFLNDKEAVLKDECGMPFDIPQEFLNPIRRYGGLYYTTTWRKVPKADKTA